MDFVESLGEYGWLGTVIPEEYDGAGLDTLEAAIVLEEIAASGAGFNGSMACHGAMFIPRSILNYGSDEMKQDLLPKLARGEEMLQCFALTEPNAGTIRQRLRPGRTRGRYIRRQRTEDLCSRLHASDWMVLVARTTPLEEVEKKTEGLSLFLVDIKDAKAQDAISADETEKNIRAAVPSYEAWFEDFEIPAENLIGVEDEGFYQVVDGLN